MFSPHLKCWIARIRETKRLEVEKFVMEREKERALTQKKKRRRKQQLVKEEEAITPREVAFREGKIIHDEEYRELEEISNELQAHLVAIKSVLSNIQRDKVNTIEAIEGSRQALRSYLRGKNERNEAKDFGYIIPPPSYLSRRRSSTGASRRTSVSGGSPGPVDALDGVASSYERTIRFLRTKQNSFLLVQALKELGDVRIAQNKIEEAGKVWNDGVDAVFGEMNSVSQWRKLLDTKYSNLAACFPLQSCMLGGIMLSNLAKYVFSSDYHAKSEHILMAARLLAVPMTSTLPHPQRLCDFAPYTAKELWPGKCVFIIPCRSYDILKTSISCFTSNNHVCINKITCICSFHLMQELIYLKRLEY